MSSGPLVSPTLKPEIQPGDYVRKGNGKAVWKVESRTKVHATLKEIWIGTMRYHVGMDELTKVNKDGSPFLGVPPQEQGETQDPGNAKG